MCLKVTCLDCLTVLSSLVFKNHLDLGIKHLRKLLLEQLVQCRSLALLVTEPGFAVCVVVESLWTTVTGEKGERGKRISDCWRRFKWLRLAGSLSVGVCEPFRAGKPNLLVRRLLVDHPSPVNSAS